MKQTNQINKQVVDFGKLLKQVEELPKEQSAQIIYYIKGVVEAHLYQNQIKKG